MRNYGGLIVLIIVLLSLIFGLYKSSTKQVIITQNKPVENTFERNNEKIKTTNISGVVVSWQAKENILEISAEDKTNKKFIFDDESQIIIPQANSRNDGLHMVRSSDGIAYDTAFCKGDTVSMAVDEVTNRVLVVMSSGYRACGFKGEIK